MILFIYIVTLFAPVTHATTEVSVTPDLRAVPGPDREWTPEREAAAERAMAAAGKTALPNMAWHLAPPETQRTIVAEEKFERLADEVVEGLRSAPSYEPRPLSKLNAREVTRLSELLGSGVGATTRERIGVALGHLARGAVPAGFRFHDEDSVENLVKCHGDVVARFLRRALHARRTNDPELLKANLLAAWLVIIHTHVALSDNAGSSGELSRLRGQAASVTGLTIAIGGLAIGMQVNPFAGIPLIVGTFGVGYGVEARGDRGLGRFAPNVFRPRAQRLTADRLLLTFWRDVDHAIRFEPEWRAWHGAHRSGRSVHRDGLRQAPEIAADSSNFLMTLWPGSAEEACEELLNALPPPK